MRRSPHEPAKLRAWPHERFGLTVMRHRAGRRRMGPAPLPADYFSRPAAEARKPALMIEGGWSSVDVGNPSSPDEQRRYIARQGPMLEAAGAMAWFQITFTDLDLAYYPAGVAPFAYNGLVDQNLVAKPALSAWDAEFAKRLR